MYDLLTTYLPEPIEVAIGLVSLIPVPVLYRLYRRTGVFDYLLFAGMFFAFAWSIFFVSLAKNDNVLIFWQLRHILLYVTYLLMFFHAVRIRYPKLLDSKMLTSSVTIWFIILTIITLFWRSMASEKALVLFWEMEPHSIDTSFSLDQPGYSAEGAGLAINGRVILSTAHPLLSYGFYFLVACTFLYIYITQEPANPTPRIIAARRLWLLASLMNFAATGLLVFWPLEITTELVKVLVVAELGVISTVALKYPESMLLSHVQLNRALNLYEKVQALSEDYVPAEIGMNRVIDYLREISTDVMHEPQ
ncbi:MAG: hypothetical protein ACFFB3_18015 [Candidatus Hodarchaeota archaeon]